MIFYPGDSLVTSRFLFLVAVFSALEPRQPWNSVWIQICEIQNNLKFKIWNIQFESTDSGDYESLVVTVQRVNFSRVKAILLKLPVIRGNGIDQFLISANQLFIDSSDSIKR